jgi:uncharacterized protein (DUF924 family)
LFEQEYALAGDSTVEIRSGEQITAAEKEVERLNVVGPRGGWRLTAARRELDAEHADDLPGDVILNGKDVGELAVITLGPELRAWQLETLSRRQAVALVVLFDQFPRNLFRTTGEAYAYDHIARDLAKRLTADGWDRFTAMERFILGLPFVHHEDMDSQDYAVMLVSEICVKAPASTREHHRFDLDQAIRHREIIRRFGRFPHRNVALGRQSTPEEIEFLSTALRGRGF